uniref:Uncharacterized protein n=1 Tax=Arundo donax TaxID=35708 RepID=A0A0A8Y895_ARUDO
MIPLRLPSRMAASASLCSLCSQAILTQVSHCHQPSLPSI